MKKHILLVENDSSELRAFVETINKTNLDYKCTWAQSGTQALDQLQYLQPDFIFIKAQLPDMSSADLLSTIRHIPKLAHTRVAKYTHPHDIKAAMLGTPITLQPATSMC
ncbi:MAG: response regulator [Bacteroidetes bacterium]|nr:response regulator [Bacteroidota bacterium]